jgi:hypothetical protein
MKKERIQIRLTLTARGVRLSRDGVHPLEVDVTGIQRRHVRVTVSIPSEEEQEEGHRLDDAVCRAMVAYRPSPSIREMFEDLSRGRLPRASRPRSEWPRDYDFISEDGEIVANCVAPFPILPEALQNAVTQVVRELNEAITRVVGLLRWRTGFGGMHQPFASRGAEWSPDGIEWHCLPRRTGADIWAEPADIQVSDVVNEDLHALVSSGISEPLGHALFREAWEQRRENPRSALLIGVSALEVGVKQFITERVQDTRWLVEELPSPPVHRMLSEYLPTLPAPEGGSEFERPSDKTLETIRDAIDARNKLAHVGRELVSPETLNEALLTIRQMLWRLDEAQGFVWARGHLLVNLPER